MALEEARATVSDVLESERPGAGQKGGADDDERREMASRRQRVSRSGG